MNPEGPEHHQPSIENKEKTTPPIPNENAGGTKEVKEKPNYQAKIDAALDLFKGVKKLNFEAKALNMDIKDPDMPSETDIVDSLKNIPGQAFLERSPKDLRLLFMKGDTVNFHGNRSAYRAIGAGNLFDRSTEYVKIDGVLGKRSQYGGGGYLNGKVGYVTANGGYLGIDTGSKIESVKLEEIKPEEQKGFEEIHVLSEEEETEAKKLFRENFGKKEKKQEKNRIELLEMIKSGKFSDKAKASFSFIMQSETSNLSDPFIRTKVRPKNGGLSSSAYGPVQITRNLARSYKLNFSEIFNPEELSYLNKFIKQGDKFLNNDNPEDPIYGYGGSGEPYFKTPEAKKLYMNMSMKMWEHHIVAAGGDIIKAAERWRGKEVSEDPRYFSALENAIRKGMFG